MDTIISIARETLFYHYNYLSIEQSRNIVEDFSLKDILVLTEQSNIVDFIAVFHKSHLDAIVLNNIEYQDIKPFSEIFNRKIPFSLTQEDFVILTEELRTRIENFFSTRPIKSKSNFFIFKDIGLRWNKGVLCEGVNDEESEFSILLRELVEKKTRLN